MPSGEEEDWPLDEARRMFALEWATNVVLACEPRINPGVPSALRPALLTGVRNSVLETWREYDKILRDGFPDEPSDDSD